MKRDLSHIIVRLQKVAEGEGNCGRANNFLLLTMAHGLY